jgi:hypothetical protein
VGKAASGSHVDGASRNGMTHSVGSGDLAKDMVSLRTPRYWFFAREGFRLKPTHRVWSMNAYIYFMALADACVSHENISRNALVLHLVIQN